MEIDDAPIERALYRIDSRLDALEEEVKALRELTEPIARAIERQRQHERVKVARLGTDLITARDIQRTYGVSRITVQNWTKHPNWPERAEIGSGRKPDKWVRGAVALWYAEHSRKPKVAAALLRFNEVERQRRGEE